MKTIQFVCMSLLTGFVLFSACSKDEQDFIAPSNQQNAELKSATPGQAVLPNVGFREDFTTANSLTAGWYLYGTPKPQWINFAFNKFGLFDNNGRYPDGSYAVSRNKIGNGQGYTIESDVYIDVTNPKGTIICPEIGVTRFPVLPSEPSHVEAGISMKLMYVGKGVTSTPPFFQNQTYVIMTVLLADGTFCSSSDPKDGTVSMYGDYAFKADVAGNGWHKMKIMVNSNSQVSFYIDNHLVWSPKKEINATLLKNKNVLLGYVSAGNAGKAYHDNVVVSYPSLPDQSAQLENLAPSE